MIITSMSRTHCRLRRAGPACNIGKMETNRLEAFSDGVLAIIITIMVLELKLPHGAQLASLTSLGIVKK